MFTSTIDLAEPAYDGVYRCFSLSWIGYVERQRQQHHFDQGSPAIRPAGCRDHDPLVPNQQPMH
jgi:drug/metabolite transporter superfamily protein YnfA